MLASSSELAGYRRLHSRFDTLAEEATDTETTIQILTRNSVRLLLHLCSEVSHDVNALLHQHSLRCVVFGHVLCKRVRVIILLLGFHNEVLHERNTVT